MKLCNERHLQLYSIAVNRWEESESMTLHCFSRPCSIKRFFSKRKQLRIRLNAYNLRSRLHCFLMKRSSCLVTQRVDIETLCRFEDFLALFPASWLSNCTFQLASTGRKGRDGLESCVEFHSSWACQFRNGRSNLLINLGEVGHGT